MRAELAQGSYLVAYRWDSGGEWNGRVWHPELPTDAQIVMHAFCTFMDIIMPQDPRSPPGKTFTSRHFVTDLEGDAVRASMAYDLCLYQTVRYPPHFAVLVNGVQFAVARGSSNLFSALCLFVYSAKVSLNGMLG